MEKPYVSGEVPQEPYEELVEPHDFPSWSPPVYIPGETDAAFYLGFGRRCLGLHDRNCREIETVTTGPFLLPRGSTVTRCTDCHQWILPLDRPGKPVCLSCTQLEGRRTEDKAEAMCRSEIRDQVKERHLVYRRCTKRRGHLGECAYLRSIGDDMFHEVMPEEVMEAIERGEGRLNR